MSTLPARPAPQTAFHELEVALLRARHELRVVTAVAGHRATEGLKALLDDALRAFGEIG